MISLILLKKRLQKSNVERKGNTMKNIEMVPVIIQDLVSYLLDAKRPMTERQNLSLRLEAIREICDEALRKHQINVASSAAASLKTMRVSKPKQARK
jgi:hypothetical protein